MRKYLIALATLALLFSFGCGGTKSSMIQNGQSYEGMEGFLDNDTLQVKSMGFAPDSETDVNKRMYMSQRAAQLNAEARIVEKLVGANVEGKTATENGTLLSEVIKKDFGGMIKGGIIKSKTFDKQTQACEITYQVTAKNLKQKAEKGNWVQ
jgi:hypothetical protein